MKESSVIIWIIIGLVLVGVLIIHILCLTTNDYIKKVFKDHSTIVFGAKGKGKDLLFQKVIYLNKNKQYLANQDYGYNAIITPISELNVDPNTYEKFINGNIQIIHKNENYEGKDYFLSDGGVFLPCQYDYQLHKKYPSFPIFYALSRHLYNMNIHCNTQNLERLWKAVREQADYYILAKGKIKLIFGLVCCITFYDNYNSASNKQLPMTARLLNGFSKAQVDQYNATYGTIKTKIYYIRKKDIKYDTRAFHKTLFGIKFDPKNYLKE